MNQYTQPWQTANFPNSPSTPFHPNTNVILVTSADEAVMRTPNNADMLYCDQSRPVFYRVVSDAFGRKSIAEYTYTVPDANSTQGVSRTEFDALVKKVQELTDSVNSGGVVNDKPVQ